MYRKLALILMLSCLSFPFQSIYSKPVKVVEAIPPKKDNILLLPKFLPQLQLDHPFLKLFTQDFYPEGLIEKVEKLAHFSLGTPKQKVLSDWGTPTRINHRKSEIHDYAKKGIELVYEQDYLIQIGVTLDETFPLLSLALIGIV